MKAYRGKANVLAPATPSRAPEVGGARFPRLDGLPRRKPFLLSDKFRSQHPLAPDDPLKDAAVTLDAFELPIPGRMRPVDSRKNNRPSHVHAVSLRPGVVTGTIVSSLSAPGRPRTGHLPQTTGPLPHTTGRGTCRNGACTG